MWRQTLSYHDVRICVFCTGEVEHVIPLCQDIVVVVLIVIVIVIVIFIVIVIVILFPYIETLKRLIP
jgi:hypothetical protein